MTDPSERWLPVVGYEGIYEVSDQGRVFSLKRRFAGARMLTPWRPAPNRYFQVGLTRDRKTRHPNVHTLVAEAFIGPRPADQQVRHLDGDTANNTLANLKYGDASDNALDRVKHGTDAHAKLTQCPYGHPYDAANTYVYRNQRSCRICRNARARRAYHQRRALALG